MRDNDDNDDLMGEDELAVMAHCGASTPRYWRSINYGPVGIKVGRRTLYRRSTVRQWLRDQEAAAITERAMADPGSWAASR